MPNLAKRPVMLLIRDGWGRNPDPAWDKYSAISQGNTPVNTRLLADYPNATIYCSGEDVGLPAGVMGNSEVGHQNIGAGRIVDQEVMRITRTIRDGSFFTNPVLVGAFEHAKQNGGSVHMMGLLSDGRVHSDLEHCKALVDMCKKQNFPGQRFFLHALMDGRDTPPTSGVTFIDQLEAKFSEAGVGRFGSVIGRFWAMDRDNRWDRVEKAYKSLTQGGKVFASAREAAQAYYDAPTNSSTTGDEFITPSSIAPTGQIDPAQLIKAGDAVIFFNYRGDRPREISKAFVLDNDAFAALPNGAFDRDDKIDNLYFAGMTGYEKGLPIKVIFEKLPRMENILGAYLSDLGLKQLRCAETEKFAHVTFFFNDYREEPFAGEERILVESPREVATYDEKPEMSAPGVCEQVLAQIAADKFDFYVVNFANPDMVGHTGSMQAAIKAVETVDVCVGRIVDAILAKGGALIVTADHGNSELMVDPQTGAPQTAHTTNMVDLIVVDDALKGATLKTGGRLADISPTALDLLGLPQPEQMTGQSLINK